MNLNSNTTFTQVIIKHKELDIIYGGYAYVGNIKNYFSNFNIKLKFGFIENVFLISQ